MISEENLGYCTGKTIYSQRFATSSARSGARASAGWHTDIERLGLRCCGMEQQQGVVATFDEHKQDVMSEYLLVDLTVLGNGEQFGV